MKHQLRLGPIAIFLAIVAAVLATLAMLTVSTSRADLVMAQRFAQTTSIRYQLEAEGNRFLDQLDAAAAKARDSRTGELKEADLAAELAAIEGSRKLENGNYEYSTSQDAYDLTIEVSVDEKTAACDVVSWKISRQWDENDSMGQLWSGNEGGL